MAPIAVITAVPREMALLEAALERPAVCSDGPVTLICGEIGTVPVVLAVGGIGKVNAALAAALLIERFKPSLVISTGCAGAYPGSGMSVGDLALARDEVQGDEGVITSRGWLDLHGMGFPLVTCSSGSFYNRFPLSTVFREKAGATARRQGIDLREGTFITVSTCSGTLQRGEELEQRFGAIAENMEGAAIAQVCLRYGVECLEVRGISNMVEERNMNAWDIPLAVDAAQRFVLELIRGEAS